MKWFSRWKQYTYYEANQTPIETDAPLHEDIQDIKLDKVKLSKKDVGPINSEADIEQLLIDDMFLKNVNDRYKNLHLKTSMKEDEDFVILPEKAWDYLHSIYGG